MFVIVESTWRGGAMQKHTVHPSERHCGDLESGLFPARDGKRLEVVSGAVSRRQPSNSMEASRRNHQSQRLAIRDDA